MNKSSFFIVGQHAVIEALKNPKRKVLRVFLTEESKKNRWCPRTDSNRGPIDYKSIALPAELQGHAQ